MSVLNPQYPHSVAITRQINMGENDAPVMSEMVVYSGPCRFYPDNGGSEKSGVRIADYKVSLPRYGFNVRIGDSITCFGETLRDLAVRITSEDDSRITTPGYARLVVMEDLFKVSGIVKQAHTGNIGANIWFDGKKN